jgi:carbamoyltransferase
VYVFPAMGDEGLGLGAALYAAGKRNALMPFRLRDVYLGPEYSEHEIETALRREEVSFDRFTDSELADRVAALLCESKVIALYRGRMEFGPRALGHRTILFQTTDPTVNEWLNTRLQRTEFMPFAPVTLSEHAGECYKDISRQRYTSQFMTITSDCTDWMKQASPAVVHLDGTARPQLITREAEPFYYQILERYHERTGIPSLVNTSFNMHEEPIVCTPQDAIRAFKQGHLDYIAIGPFLAASKTPQS